MIHQGRLIGRPDSLDPAQAMASLFSSRLLRRSLVVLIVLLCVGLGEFWLYAANSLARHMHEQAFGGAAPADFCASSDIGGFPFRLRLNCSQFSAPLRLGQSEIVAKADEARGEASIFAPNHIVLTLSSPLSLQKPDGSTLAKLRHDGMTLDLTWSAHGLDQAQIDANALDWRPEAPEAGIAFNLQKLTVLLKPVGDAVHLDMAGEGLTAPLLQSLLQKPDLGRFSLSGQIAPAPAATEDWRAAIEAWRAKSGAVTVEKFDWQAGDLSLRLDGALGLDDAHRPTGRLNLAAKGAGPLLARLGLPVSAAQAQNLLGALLGKPQNKPEAGDSLALPLILDKGKIYLGPLRLSATLEPLY
jgi:hypothetical protein